MFQGSYINIIISSTVIYLFIIIAIRLFGKKELAQLSVVDLVFILLISNAVQNAMVGSDTSLVGGLIAAGTLFIINFIFKQIIYLFPRLGRVIQGESVMIIYKGKLIEKNVVKAKLTKDEIFEAIREHGVGTVEEVDLAVLEVDGNISVLSNDFTNKTLKKRKGRKFSSSQVG